MSRSFLEAGGTRALERAIASVESRSAAEVVIAIRPRSGSYLHADVLVGAVAATATLATMLFAPWPFELAWFVIDPLVFGMLAGLATSRLAPLRRWLTPPRARAARVREASLAAFTARGVHHTRDRTGILVFASLLERRVEVVADVGVERAVPTSVWRSACEAIHDAVAAGGDAEGLARAIDDLGEILESALPRREDDVNELPDEVCA